MKVFVVTAGEHSSYHIVEIFSTRELTEQFYVGKFCSKLRAMGLHTNIEEWDLDRQYDIVGAIGL
jgi:hypothetical protein